jgi:hypothetical protein
VCFAGAAEKSSKHGAEDKAQSVMTAMQERMKQRVCDKPEIFELLRYTIRVNNLFWDLITFMNRTQCILDLKWPKLIRKSKEILWLNLTRWSDHYFPLKNSEPFFAAMKRAILVTWKLLLKAFLTVPANGRQKLRLQVCITKKVEL